MQTHNTKNTTCHSDCNGGIPLSHTVWNDTKRTDKNFTSSSLRNLGLKSAIERDTSTPLGMTRWRKFAWFTLVELIVVITILVILGTIAFMNLSGYSGNARDSSRVSDLTNLSKGLDIAYIKTSSYPTPDNPFTVTYSGWTIWTQGTIGDTVMNIIGTNGAKMNKKPTDPLSTTKEYTYSKLAYGNAYQIKADWEGDIVAYRNSIIEQANAASGNPTLAYIKGTYNGISAKTETGTTICLIALPSIVSNTGSASQTIALETNNLLSGSLLMKWGSLTGTPFKPALTGQGNPIVYCSGSLPSTTTEQRAFATNLANAYSGTVLATNPNIQPFISALSDTNSGTLLASLGGGLVTSSLGGSTSTPLPANPPHINGSCGSASGTTVVSQPSGSSACNTWNLTGTGFTSNVYSWTCQSPDTGTSASCKACNTGYAWDTGTSACMAVDPYWSNVVLALHMDGNNGGIIFSDSSPTPKVIVSDGVATTSTTQKKYGTASLSPGAGANDGIYINNTSDLDLTNGPATIEFWAYFNNTTDIKYLAGNWTTGAASGPSSWAIYQNGANVQVYTCTPGAAYYDAGTGLNTSTTITSGQWYHFALVSDGTTVRFFKDGVVIGSIAKTGFGGSNSSKTVIGRAQTAGYALNGYIDDFRITKGIARYTTNFTPPTITFPNQ